MVKSTKSRIVSQTGKNSEARSAAKHDGESQVVEQLLFPYGIGIDTHSKFIQVCVLLQVVTGAGGSKIVRHEKSFPTEWLTLVEAAKWAGKLVKQPADSLRYCIESTGCYHLPVLQAWKGTPSVVNPLLAGGTRRKTDVLDARLLAHHSITGMWKVSFIPSENVQQLRVLWAARGEAARAATRHSNRINNLILRFGHTVGAEHSMRSAEAEGVIDDLIAGRKPINANVAPAGLPKAMRPVIAELYVRMRSAIVEAKDAQKVAKQFVLGLKWPTCRDTIKGDELLRILQTVPGVGERSAIMWLCEVGDPRRFQHAKQVAAFCGCDPSLKISAGKVTSHVRRAGNARLHTALGYAAQAVMQKPDCSLAQWGKSIAGRHKKGGYRKAVGAVTRRLACALWHVHRLGVDYNDSQYTYAQGLVVGKGLIEDVVGKRYVPLLKANKINNIQALADGYVAGDLAKIRGFGDKALKLVREWAVKQREQPKKPRTFKLDGRKKYEKRPNTASDEANGNTTQDAQATGQLRGSRRPQPVLPGMV